MFKKIALTCCIAAGLSACKQEVVGTLYVRDLLEVLESKKDIPVDISINVYEMGIAKKCNDPKSDQIVKAVAAQFQSATLAGCETIQGSMRDRMTIKATTVLTTQDDQQLRPAKYLLQFNAMKTSVPDTGKSLDGFFVIAQFDKAKYEQVQKAVRAVDMMAGIDLNDIGIKITINNDLRQNVIVAPSIGSFVDGYPSDRKDVQYDLEPRKESEFTFGNVKATSLVRYDWATIAAFAVRDNQGEVVKTQ